MCQNPKCVKKPTKIAWKCSKNVSKFKMYWNSDKNDLINVVKIWQKPQIWQFFVTFYMRNETFSGNIVRQKLTKLWQNGLFVTFLTHFWCLLGNISEILAQNMWQKCVKTIVFDSFLSQFCPSKATMLTQRPLKAANILKNVSKM